MHGPLTLYMAAAASVLLLILCAASGDFALPQTASGWIGFLAAAALYGFRNDCLFHCHIDDRTGAHVAPFLC